MGQDQVFAHSKSNEPAEHREPLLTHLERAAELARSFADAFDAGGWGYLAGLWHDVGNIAQSFSGDCAAAVSRWSMQARARCSLKKSVPPLYRS